MDTEALKACECDFLIMKQCMLENNIWTINSIKKLFQIAWNFGRLYGMTQANEDIRNRLRENRWNEDYTGNLT